MKSPHKHGWGAYEDPFPNRDLPEQEEKLVTMGYKFLGWQSAAQHTPQFIHCLDEAHNYYAVPNTWHSVQHTPSGSDVTQWCMKDKVYWKVDMS